MSHTVVNDLPSFIQNIFALMGYWYVLSTSPNIQQNVPSRYEQNYLGSMTRPFFSVTECKLRDLKISRGLCRIKNKFKKKTYNAAQYGQPCYGYLSRFLSIETSSVSRQSLPHEEFLSKPNFWNPSWCQNMFVISSKSMQ